MPDAVSTTDFTAANNVQRHVITRVKWFSQAKGYGFVETEDGTQAFLHAEAAAIGSTSGLSRDARLVVDIAQDKRGDRVVMVHSIYPADDRLGGETGSGVDHRDHRGHNGRARDAWSEPASKTVSLGKVKWFNYKNGYGFIVPDRQGDDIFIHKSALARSGISAPLKGGERVSIVLTDGRDGRPQVERIKLI